MPIDLTNDELIAVPLANLRPGELRRAFLVEAIDAGKKQEAVNVQRTLAVLQVKQEEESEHEHRELERREETLLAGLQEREREIFQEAEELDRRAIKLHDGRRAYVDGDRFRDAEGRELHGADRAAAEQLHLEQPAAATWQEHQAIEQKMKDAERLRHQVEDLKNAPDSAAENAALTRSEKEFARQTAADLKDTKTLPDYGSGDIGAAFGLSKSFQAATTTPGQETPRGLPAPPVAAPAASRLTL